MKRILQIQTQAEAGGAQRVSDMLSFGLIKSKHNVITAFLYRRTDAYDYDPNARYMLKYPPRSFSDYIKSLWNLIKLCNRFKPKVIIGFQHYGNIAGVIAAVFCPGCKLVANQNAMPNGVGIPPTAMLIDKILGIAGAYRHNVVNSRVTEEAFMKYPKRYTRSIRRIDHGVACFESELSVDEARKKLGLPLGARIIGSAGRLADQKNHQLLLPVLVEHSDKYMVVAGAGPLKEILLEKAKSLDVSDRIVFVGEIPPHDMGDFFKAIDVFVFPSVWETFGLAVVEAAVSGVPVVCSDLPILKEVLTTEEGESAAIFADPKDSEDFSRKIDALFNDGELVLGLSRASKSIRDRYSVEKMVNSYEELFH